MQKEKTKALTYGAAMLALFIALFIVSIYVPLIGLIAFFISPIPIAWYAANFPRISAIWVSVLGMLLAFIAANLLGLILGIVCVVTGLVIGDGIRRQKSKVYILMSTGISTLFTFTILFIGMQSLVDINFIEDGMSLFEKSYQESLEYSVQQTGQELSAEDLQYVFDRMQMALPALVTLTAFVLATIFLMVTTSVLARLNVAVPKFSAFRNMRLPKAILWYYLIVLSINLFVQPEVGTTLDLIVWNCSIVLWILLVLQGISLIFYAIDAFKYPYFIKILVAFMSIPMYSFVVLVGIVDLGFNVRQFIDEKSQK